MHLQLFAVLIAVCIAASYAQGPPIPIAAVVDLTVTSSVETVDVTTTSANTTVASQEKEDKSSEDDDEEKGQKFDHVHKEHHEHEATISVDVHNVLDLFKEQLKKTEERIIAAVKNDNSSSASSEKSYRTADRKAKKDEKKKKDQKKGKKDNKDEDDEDD